MTAIETAKRHNEAICLRLEGKSWPQVAALAGLSERRCQEVYKEWADKDKTALMGEDPIEVVREQLAGFKMLRSMAADVFREAAGFTIPAIPKEDAEDGRERQEIKVAGNASARVGALRLISDLRKAEIDLRARAGLMPKNLGGVPKEIDVRYWTQQIIDIFQQNKIPEEVWDEVLALLGDDPKVLEVVGGGRELMAGDPTSN